MPIYELQRLRITCTGCGAVHDYEGLPRQLPDGWTDDPASHQSMWFRDTWCRKCSEQREERGDE